VIIALAWQPVKVSISNTTVILAITIAACQIFAQALGLTQRLWSLSHGSGKNSIVKAAHLGLKGSKSSIAAGQVLQQLTGDVGWGGYKFGHNLAAAW